MIFKRDIRFTPNGKIRRLHIWLPDGYEFSDERYPVMYFFDGHNLFRDEDATYGKSWGLADFLRGWDKPMIVVGIECGHEGNERLVEYCPYHYQGKFWGDIQGTGEETLRFMAEELKPMIDREYRTWPQREATGIAGSSMGGLMAVYAGIRWNHVYSKAACLSSAIGTGMRELERDVRRSSIDPDTRIYLSWGTEEAGGTFDNHELDWLTATAKRNVKLGSRLHDKGAIVRLECQRGGHHCEADWEKQVPDFMGFLWQER